MNDLTDFTNTDDVSDAAIEWVAGALRYGTDWIAPSIRNDAADGDKRDQGIIIAARLIQAHRPELIVDPVDAIIEAQIGLAILPHEFRKAAKRLYLMGLEAGKASK